MSELEAMVAQLAQRVAALEDENRVLRTARGMGSGRLARRQLLTRGAGFLGGLGALQLVDRTAGPAQTAVAAVTNQPTAPSTTALGHIVWLDERAFDLAQVNNATQADQAPVLVPLPPSIPWYATMLVTMLHIMESTGRGAEMYVMPGDIPTPTPTLYFGAESGPAGFWDKHWGLVRIGANRAIQYQVTWVAAGGSGNMRLRIVGYTTP